MASISESVLSKRTAPYKGSKCRDCRRIIGQEYNGNTLHIGSLPVSKRSKNVTCRPCRDQPVCAGGCERREIPDGIKLVQTNCGKMCRDCIQTQQKLDPDDVREVRGVA